MGISAIGSNVSYRMQSFAGAARSDTGDNRPAATPISAAQSGITEAGTALGTRQAAGESSGESYLQHLTGSFVSAITADGEKTAEVTGEAFGEDEASEASSAGAATPDVEPGEELSGEEAQAVEKLQQRDTEVRAHEAAHVAAAGQYANGGASFSYERGPDGKQYAVGGDVSISVSEERTPEATIAKMQTVRRAALAPASPSAQDRRVAAEASQIEAAAQKELSGQTAGEPSGALSNGSEEGAGETSPQSGGIAAVTAQAKSVGARAAYGAFSSSQQDQKAAS